MTGTTNVRSALLVATFTAALLVVAVAGGVGVGEATAQQTAGECREINDSFVGANSTVVLQNDVQASGGCLTVTADGVTVDGNGHVVNGSGEGTGVVVAAENVDVVDLTVVNVTATGNGEFGIVVNRDPDATVRDSVARENGAGLLAGDGVRVVDTTAANNSGGGIPGLLAEFYGQVGAPGVDLVDVRAEDGVAAENLTVGNATLSGTLTRVNVTGVAPPAGPPGDRVCLGGNADVDPHAEGAYADFRLGYTDAEAVSADEANASLYHYNGTAWVPVDGSAPDPAANAVAGNVTAFSNVSAFAGPDDPPVARLSASQTGGSVVLDASNSTDPDSAIDRYEWDFDGDGTYEETTTVPTTTYGYEGGGSYDAVVRVASKGLDDTASVTVESGYAGGGDATDLGSRISIESVEADRDEVGRATACG